jgi:protein SCO1/2
VASVLNVQYREVSEGQFSHTNLITLLDPNGVVTTKIEGLKQPVEPLVASLNKIAGDS